MSAEETAARVERALFKVESISQDMRDIKETMRELATAVSKLAIIEERQTTDRAEISRAYKRLEGHETRIATLELAQPDQKRTAAWVDKVVWLVLGAVLSGVMSMVVVKANAQSSAKEIPQLTMPTK